MTICWPYLLIFALITHDSDAIPVRATEMWSVILCKFRDNPYEPKSKEWFEDWLTDLNDQGKPLSFED